MLWSKSARKIRELEDKISALEQIVLQQRLRIEELEKILQEKTHNEEKLQEIIQGLKERVNKNSNNSSKPPSTDGLEKPKPKSLREPSGKKPGGQPGHKGSGLSLDLTPTETILHAPAQCEGCPMKGTCVRCGISPAHNVLDVKIETQVTAHYVESYACPRMEQKVIHGEFPEGINSSLQYGLGIRALSVALNTIGMMSVNRTHDLLEGLLGLPISTGTIVTMVNQCAQTLEPTLEEIRQALLQRPIVHFDETGTRVDGKTRWVHSACDPLYTYLSAQEKRGTEGMDAAGILPTFPGIAIHDCWSPYWSYSVAGHGLCCAHLLRELNGVIENDEPEKAKWAEEMKALLLEMKEYKDSVLEQENPTLEPPKIAKYEERYDQIIHNAYQAYPVSEQPVGKRGRPKRGKRLALIDRLAKHKGEVCLFVHNLAVPFTNNLAEQSVRMMKVKNKVCGCFRSQDGISVFTKIMSYLQSAAKHDVPAFVAISQALRGNSHQVIFGRA